MPVNLVVYFLIPEKNDIVEQWLSELEDYLNRDQAFAGNNRISIQRSDRVANAAWMGHPFILVGRQADVEAFLSHLPKDARRIVNDCGYYWILSDTDSYFLAPERIIVLNWHHKLFEVIADRLRTLVKYPRLAGLSRGLHHVRSEIDRLTDRETGPWSSTLILGESGTGKEEVAQSLYAASSRKGKFFAVACGTFTPESLNDELFGHIKGAFTGAINDKKGLLEEYSAGVLFLDDFDTVMTIITGPLLRVMSTSKGSPAEIKKIGKEIPEKKGTKVWLLFSTNAGIQKLIEEGKLREDFIFRFSDRVIHIPPLRKRPADIPAIAHHLWDRRWEENDPLKRELTPVVLQHMFSRETEWEGNVRALHTLLSLTSSMVRMPARNDHPLREIMDEIMSRGPGYKNWVGIIASPSFTDPVLLGTSVIQEIRETSDEDIIKDARARLTPEGETIFNEAFDAAKTKGGGKAILQPIRLARIIAYVGRQNEISKQDWTDLCKKIDVSNDSKLGEGTFGSDMELLAGGESGEGKKLIRKGNKQGKMDVYEPVPGMFK